MKTNKTILVASGSILAAGMAQGAVIINPVNQILGTGDNGYNLDLNSDGASDFRIFFDANNASKPCVLGTYTGSGSSYPGTFPNPTGYVFNELNMNPVSPDSNENNGVPVIPGGTTISSQFTVGAYTLTIGDPNGDKYGKNEGYLNLNGDQQSVGQWSSGQDTVGFVGLAMVDNTLGIANYGWVELDYNGPNATLTVLETGFETTPNTPIVTPVPEPATVALAGLAGVLVVLAKRKKA